MKDDSANRSLINFFCYEVQSTHSPGLFYGKNPLNSTFTLLMLQYILIVSITSTLRVLLKPLRQPRFVSDIIGGIMLGPTVLGRSKTFNQGFGIIFPQNARYLIKTIGTIGIVFYLLLTTIKMDITLALRASKKELSFAVFGTLIPFVVGIIITFSIRDFIDQDLRYRPQVLVVIIGHFTVSSFAVTEQILRELNLLSSELGRLALATTILTDIVGIICSIAFDAARHYDVKPLNTLWAVLSAIILVGFVLLCKHAFTWIVNTTPEGKPVHESYVVAIFLGTLVMSFLTDFTGNNAAVGPHWLGFVIPTGPPLGATLVERLETILTEFFMPFVFMFIGGITDSQMMSEWWSVTWTVLTMAAAVSVAKFFTIYGVSRFHEMPVKDSLALSFVLTIKGQIDLIIYLHWAVVKALSMPTLTVLVLFSTIITMVSTPMITILYDPTRPYMVNKRRAIQYTSPNTELKIVACIYDQESVAGFINLLEVSTPTTNSPLTIYSLRLIELQGRSHPIFVDHENQAEAFELTNYNQINNALTLFQESVGECVKCYHFTSVSPTRSMYQDVCKLAMNKKATIIILPFKTESLDGRTEVVHRQMLHFVNPNVLSHAPCSVGILVDRTGTFNNRVNYTTRTSGNNFIILFLGGADAREALAYADRMASNPNVSLSVIRFLSSNSLGDNPMEKKLDDGLITWFWVKNEGNEQVIYKEIVVSDGSETVLAIQAIMSDCIYDLWIVGRKNGINPVLLQGLSSWSKNDELGVIGDYLTNVDLAMNASILVVQQQVLRGQEVGNSDAYLPKITCCY